MTPDERDLPAERPEDAPRPADPLAGYRHLPLPPRREDLVETSAVSPPPGTPEPAGDVNTEFMIRYAS